MNPFNKSFQEITFKDVEDFCKQQHPESTTLDYKQAMPKDLAKHFATFSNTLGGVIIIGVEEDPKTGLPLEWEGVANDAKLIERVNQFAANVAPLPTFSVRSTDDVKGKVFILINILEGDMPPYTTHNDPTVWLRTGNTSTPLRQAERDELARMEAKKTRAEQVRQSNLDKAKAIFVAGLNEAEQERQELLSNFEAASTPHGIPRQPHTENNAFLTVSLQPFYPDRTLVEPWEIKQKLRDLNTRSNRAMEMPPLDMEPCPGGLFAIKAGGLTGVVHAYELFENGLLSYTENVWLSDGGRQKVIYMTHIASALYRHLLFASKYYAMFNYSGVVKGEMTLEDTLGASLEPILPRNAYRFGGDAPVIGKISNYSWPLELDTNVLHNPQLRDDFFKETMRRIYWDLGIENIAANALENYLEDFNWQ